MKYLKKYNFFILCILASIATSVFSIVVQFFRADIVDVAIFGGDGFWRVSFLFVAFIILEIIFHYLYRDFKERHVLKIGLKMQRDVLSYNFDNYKKASSENKSHVLSVILKQVDLVKHRYYANILHLLDMVIKSALVVFVMLNVNIYLTLFIILMLLNQIFLPKLLSKILNKLNKEYITNIENLTKKLDDHLSNLPLIINFSIVNIAKRKLFGSFEKTMESEYKRFNGNNLVRNINMLNSYSTHFVVLIVCAYLMLNGHMAFVTFYLIMGLVEQLTMPLIGISFAYQDIVGNKDLAKDLKKYEQEYIAKKNIATKFSKEIIVQNLTYAIDDKKIIDGFNYTFEKNKKYLIQGASGSGKTTLLNILHQSIDKFQGNIALDNTPYSELHVKNIIGLMDDTPSFIQGTIRENIVLGKSVEEEKLLNTIAQLGLGKIASRLEEEISFIEENLSLGERKRIELMRLIIRDFDIFLLDEPTSNLDTANRKALIDIIKSLGNKTIICTSHETKEDFVEIFDEVMSYGD